MVNDNNIIGAGCNYIYSEFEFENEIRHSFQK